MVVKILLVHASSDVGGGSVHLRYIIENLNEKNFDVYLACPAGGSYYDVFSKMLKNDVLDVNIRGFSFFDLYKLILFIKKEKIDIVHTHGKGAGLWARCASIFVKSKFIHTFHGIHYDMSSFIMKKFYYLFEYVLSFATDFFINVSASERDICIKHSIVNPNRNKIIYNAVKPLDSHLCEISAFKKKYKLENKFIIGTVARFDPVKNILMLIRAFEKCCQISDSYYLVLVGDGSQKKEIVDYLNDKNLYDKVLMTGFVDNPCFYIKIMDVFVLPSFSEGMPYTLLEAKSAKTAVIGTNVRGINDLIVPGKNGLLVQSDNVKELCLAIESLRENRGLLMEISENGYAEYLEKYHIDNMISLLEKVYMEIL